MVILHNILMLQAYFVLMKRGGCCYCIYYQIIIELIEHKNIIIVA